MHGTILGDFGGICLGAMVYYWKAICSRQFKVWSIAKWGVLAEFSEGAGDGRAPDLFFKKPLEVTDFFYFGHFLGLLKCLFLPQFLNGMSSFPFHLTITITGICSREQNFVGSLLVTLSLME